MEKVAYIAGQMRGIPDFNFAAFDAVDKIAVEKGFKIFNPAQMDRASKDQVAKTDDEATALSKVYCKRDVDALLQCTHIIMLPGWENSVGATAEYHVARWLQLEILDAETFQPLDGTGQRAELMAFHRQMCNKALQIMRVKNHDYGATDDPFANFRSSEVLEICSAEQSFMVRWADKLKRAATFVKRGMLMVKDESMQDTLVDAINYPILLAAYLKFGKTKLAKQENTDLETIAAFVEKQKGVWGKNLAEMIRNKEYLEKQ